MGIVIRQSFKASVVAYVGVGLGLINNLFVATKLLSPEQLALSRILVENSLVFAAFAHLGTPYITDRFYNVFRNQSTHQGFLGFMMLLALLGTGVFCGIYWLFRHQIVAYFIDESPELIEYHFLALPLTAFWVFIVLLEAYSRNQARITVPTLVKELYIKSFNIGLIVIYAVGWISFDYLMVGIVIMYGIAVIILIVYIWQLKKLFLKGALRFFKAENFRAMVVYGSFVILGGIGENIFKLIDRTMLAGEQGLQESAIFILASFIITTLEIPRRALTQITIPLLSEALQKNELEQVKKLYHKGALNQFIASLFVFLGIWCCIDELFIILPKGEIYSKGKGIVLALGLASLFSVASGIRAEIISYSKHFRFGIYFVIVAAILNIFLNHTLIPLYSYNGAAWATAIATVIYTLTQVLFVGWRFKTYPYQKQQLIVVLIALGIFFIMAAFPKASSLVSAFVLIIIKASLITLLYFLILLKFRVSDELNEVARYLWKRLQGYLRR